VPPRTRRPLEPTWRAGYRRPPGPRPVRRADYSQRLALAEGLRDEAAARRERWALNDAREMVLELLAARVAQLADHDGAPVTYRAGFADLWSEP
jgi:hypothetical protein